MQVRGRVIISVASDCPGLYMEVSKMEAYPHCRKPSSSFHLFNHPFICSSTRVSAKCFSPP